MLLHDDGTRLWAIRLSGERQLIWRHPRARVVHIAASPGGEELALSVALSPRRASDPSFVLYLLAADGSVQTVDIVSDFRSIDSLIFLRPPTERKGPEALYWLRMGEEVDPATGRLDTTVLTLTDEGPQEVAVPLRYAEAVFDIQGYPGNPTFTISLFRHNNEPTRLEVLHNVDVFRRTDASRLLWANNEFRANTDVFVGVAWVSPTDYVIPVAMEFFPEEYQLRFFRVGCEYLGSEIAYQGQAIDWGYAETPWYTLPGGRDRVLVLGAEDLGDVAAGRSETAPWLAVRLKNGSIEATDAVWEQGAWTWVAPATRFRPYEKRTCRGIRWDWPS